MAEKFSYRFEVRSSDEVEIEEKTRRIWTKNEEGIVSLQNEIECVLHPVRVQSIFKKPTTDEEVKKLLQTNLKSFDTTDYGVTEHDRTSGEGDIAPFRSAMAFFSANQMEIKEFVRLFLKGCFQEENRLLVKLYVRELKQNFLKLIDCSQCKKANLKLDDSKMCTNHTLLPGQLSYLFDEFQKKLDHCKIIAQWAEQLLCSNSTRSLYVLLFGIYMPRVAEIWEQVLWRTHIQEVLELEIHSTMSGEAPKLLRSW